MQARLAYAEERCQALQTERDAAVEARKEADAALLEAKQRVAEAEVRWPRRKH